MIRRLFLLVVFFAATGPVLGGAAAPPDLIAGGVTLAGVPVGGMSYEQAQATLAPAFSRSVQLVHGADRWRINPSRFGGNVSVAAGVSRALKAPANVAVPLTPHVDAAAVRQFVAALDKRLSYQAKDAHLVGLNGLTPEIADGKPGLQVVRGLTVQRVVRAFESPQRPRIRVAAKVLAPKVTRAKFGPVIVIRRGSNELRYYEGTKFVRTFPVATGQAIYPTPLGTWSIVDMERNPWWRPPTYDAWARGLKPVPPGPDNPLGTRWMGLSAPGVGIHGTDAPASIGYSASHGCIRMQVPDAEWLFEHVHLGTPVVIVGS